MAQLTASAVVAAVLPALSKRRAGGTLSKSSRPYLRGGRWATHRWLRCRCRRRRPAAKAGCGLLSCRCADAAQDSKSDRRLIQCNGSE
jgi:hypothetical protein